MDNGRELSELPIAKGIAALADAMDGLADLGLTMSQIRDPAIVGRDECIAKQLSAVQQAATTLDSLVAKLDLEKEAKIRLRVDLQDSATRLVRSFSKISNEIVDIADCKKLANEIVENWSKLRRSIYDLTSLLQLSSESWCMTIVEREPAYHALLQNVLMSPGRPFEITSPAKNR